MNTPYWQELRLVNPDENRVWELFHENSKTNAYDSFLPQEEILRRMQEMQECLKFDQYPAFELPPPVRLDAPLDQVIQQRMSCRVMSPATVPLNQLAALLHYSYGVTRSNEGTGMPRASRAVPSGGALFPLEIFVHGKSIEGMEPGLFHYNPLQNNIRRVLDGDLSPRIAECLVPFQSHLATDTSLMFFVTALFERSTFKYNARGYRFVLLEAGHVAQNLNLAAASLGLGAIDIGGYFDRKVDNLLGVDGIVHSTVYMIGVGKPVPDNEGRGQML